MITIRRLRLIVFLCTFLLIAAFLVATFWALGTQRDDARVINVAGRQRMLIQQMNLAVLDVQSDVNPIYRQTLHKTAETFEQTLNALIFGGEVSYTDGTTVTLPATPANETIILDQLAVVRATWNEMHLTIHSVLESDPQSATFTEAVARVEQLSPTLLAQMDQVAHLYEIASRRKIDLVQNIGLGFLAVAMISLVAVYRVTERQVLRPLDRLRAAARNIGEGDLATPVPIAGLGEVDALAHSLDEMRRKLGASAEAQSALLEFSQRLLAAKDERDVLESAVEVAASALGADFSALAMADDEGRLFVRAVRGWPADYVGRLELGRGDASQTGYTVLHGHPVAVEDYATETAFRAPPVVFEHGIVSGLSVPMILAGRVVGAILVHSRTRRRFSEEEIRLLSLIGNQTAIALDKMHLLATERQRADELDALRATLNDVLVEFELPRFFQTLLQRAVALLNASGGDLGIYEPATNEILIVASYNMGKDYAGTRMQLGEGAMGWVAATKQPLIIQDYAQWEKRSPKYAEGPWHAVMAVPLLTPRGDQLVGVIGIVDVHPQRTFSQADLRLLTLFAQPVTLALERTRLFDEERRTREAVTALLEIAQVAGSSLELGQVLKHIAQHTAQACHANRCTIFLLDDTGQVLQPVMSQFADGHVDLEQWQTFKATTADRIDMVPLFRDAIRERRPALLDDASRTDLVPLKWTLPFGIQKLLAVPLVSRDQAIGLMALDHAEANREFTPEQINLALTIGGQVTSAITNARLYAKAERRAAEMNALQQTALDLVSHLETYPLLKTIVRRATELLGSTGGVIYQWEPTSQQLCCTISYGLSRDYTNVTLKPGEGVAGRVYLTGKPLVVNDYPHWEGRAAHLLDIPSQTVIGIPILWHDRVIGVLNINDESGTRTFDDQDVQLLSLFANQAAIAMENARLFEETQRLAVTDSLTSLPNRRALEERLQDELRRAQRYQHPLSVIMVDIDHFKHYNDIHGHPQGDIILRQVAHVLRARVRETDFVARYGGEEFLILLPETPKAAGLHVAEKIRIAVQATPFPHAETQPGGRLTISLGIVTFPDDLPEPADLVQCADQALYHAKRSGRNRVCGYANVNYQAQS